MNLGTPRLQLLQSLRSLRCFLHKPTHSKFKAWLNITARRVTDFLKLSVSFCTCLFFSSRISGWSGCSKPSISVILLTASSKDSKPSPSLSIPLTYPWIARTARKCSETFRANRIMIRGYFLWKQFWATWQSFFSAKGSSKIHHLRFVSWPISVAVTIMATMATSMTIRLRAATSDGG